MVTPRAASLPHWWSPWAWTPCTSCNDRWLLFDGLVCWVSLNTMCWMKRTSFTWLRRHLAEKSLLGRRLLEWSSANHLQPSIKALTIKLLSYFIPVLFFYFLNIPLFGYLPPPALLQMIVWLDSLYFAEIFYLVVKTSSRGHVCIVLQVLYPTYLRVLGKVLYRLNIRNPRF